MNPISLFSRMGFEPSFHCTSDALGSSTSVVVGGVSGTLEMPNLPDWSDEPPDPLRMPLIPPRHAETWKQGGRLMHWGLPSRYPSGDSEVSSVLLHFQVTSEDVREAATAIHLDTARWYAHLVDFHDLITKRPLALSITILNEQPNADLFCWGANGRQERPYDISPSDGVVVAYSGYGALTREKLQKICNLASTDKPIALEYRIQLEAYRGYSRSDYRKAIIETAVAAELAITNGLRRRFETERVVYGEKLLKKFRMLGGRLELARVVGLELPGRDLERDLIDPRNSVIHKASFVDESMARHAIDATDELLWLLCPSLAEQT